MKLGLFIAGSHGPVVAALGGAGALVQHSPLGFVVAFGAGIVSFASPCVLPLVPSYLSMMSGVGVSSVVGTGPPAASTAGSASSASSASSARSARSPGSPGSASSARPHEPGLAAQPGLAAGIARASVAEASLTGAGSGTATLVARPETVSAGPSGRYGLLGSDKGRLLLSTLLFVAGFSLVFALLEATASALFHPLQSHKAVLADVAGALIIAMGALLAFQLPWFQQQRRLAIAPSKLGPWVAPVMGMTFAFGWTPCITPALAAVLGLASSGGTLARGEEMLVAYSLGLGVPFVVTGLAFGRLSAAFRFFRRHSRAVSLVSGSVLAALGVLIITGEVGTLSAWSSSFMQNIGLGGLASG